MSTSLQRSLSPTSGDGKVTVPNMFDLTREQAIAALHTAGYEGQVSDAHGQCGSVVDGRVIELGHVCDQAPVAGTVMGSRLPIELRVQDEDPRHGSVGRITEWYLMPQLVGMPLDTARAELERVGFVHEERVKVSWVEAPGCKPLTVCETYPAAMQRHGINDDTVLSVGRGPSVSPGTDRSTKPATSAHAASQPGETP